MRQYLLLLAALCFAQRNDRCTNTEVIFFGRYYPEEVGYTIDPPPAQEISGAFTLNKLQGEWSNSWHQSISISGTTATVDSYWTFQIDESDDMFELNGWTISKDATSLVWTTDEYSVSWFRPEDQVECHAAPTTLVQGENVMNCCLTEGRHTLVCSDSYSDGWHGSYITINEQVFCHDFVARHEAIHEFNMPLKHNEHECENYDIFVRIGEDGGRMMSFSVTSSMCVWQGNNRMEVGSTVSVTCCLASGHHKLTCVGGTDQGFQGGYVMIDGVTYCESFSGGTSQQTITLGDAEPQCEDGEDWIPIEFHTGADTLGLSWEVIGADKCHGEQYAAQSHYYFHCCLQKNWYYELNCKSSENTGFHGSLLVIDDEWYCYEDFLHEGTEYLTNFVVPDPPRGIEEPEPCTDVRIHINSVWHSSLLRWEIQGTSCKGTGDEGHRDYEVMCCLQPETEYTLKCYDISWDRWNGYLQIGDRHYCNNMESWVMHETQFVAHQERQCMDVNVYMHTGDTDTDHEWMVDNGEHCHGMNYEANRVYTKDCCLTPGWHMVTCADHSFWNFYYGYWWYGYYGHYGYGSYGYGEYGEYGHGGADHDDDPYDDYGYDYGGGWYGGYLEIGGHQICDSFDSGFSHVEMVCLGDAEDCDTGTFSCDIIIRRRNGCNSNERLVTKGEAQRCYQELCADTTNGEIGLLDDAYFLGLSQQCSVQEQYIDQYHLQVGSDCMMGYMPIVTGADDCTTAARALGFSGYDVSRISDTTSFGTTKPQGCFFDGSTGIFMYNSGEGGAAEEGDQILCVQDDEGVDESYSLCVHNTMDDQCTDVTIQLQTGDYANEITWMINDGSTCFGSNYPDKSFITETCCLGDNTHTVTCVDSFGDSWHGGYILIDGKVVCREMQANYGAKFYEQEIIIGMSTNDAANVDCQNVVFEITAVDMTTQINFHVVDDESCSYSSDLSLGTGVFETECCLRQGPHTLQCVTLWGEGWNDGTRVTMNGEVLCENMPPGFNQNTDFTISGDECPEGLVHSRIHVYAEGWASEVGWYIDDGACGSLVYNADTLYTNSCCLAPGDHELICQDNSSFGDGWDGDSYISINGERFCEDFSTGYVLTTQFKIEAGECYYDHTYTSGAVISADAMRGGGCDPYENPRQAYICAGRCDDDSDCNYWTCYETCTLYSTNGFGIQPQAGAVGGPQGCLLNDLPDSDGPGPPSTDSEDGDDDDDEPTRATTRHPDGPCQDTEIEIEVHPSYYAFEMVYEIMDENENVVCRGEGYSDYEVVTETCCLVADAEYSLVCIGTAGTGYNTGYILVDEQEYCREFYDYYNDPIPITVGDEPQQPDDDCVTIDIYTYTTDYAYEITWTIDDGACSSPYLYDKAMHSQTCCLPEGTHTLTCMDYAYDGWHGGYVMVAGVMYCNDFLLGHELTRSFEIDENTHTHETMEVEYYEEHAQCTQNDVLTQNECRYVAEENGSILYVEHGEGYPAGCYLYGGWYYYNVHEDSPTYCHFTDYCLCRGEDHNTHTGSTYEPLLNPDDIDYYVSAGDACDNVLTYTECVSLFSDYHVYSLNTFEAPYGCHKYAEDVFYNIHKTNVRCLSEWFSDECYCKSPEPTDSSPGVYYLTDDTQCPMVLSPAECETEAYAQDHMYYEETVYGFPYGCYKWNLDIPGSGNYYFFNNLPNHAGCSGLGVECACHRDLTADNPPIVYDDSCDSSNDGICDLPPFCRPNTDCTDCGSCHEGGDDVDPPALSFDPVVIREGTCDEFLTMSECQSAAGYWDINTIDSLSSPGGCITTQSGDFTFNNARSSSQTFCSHDEICHCRSASGQTPTTFAPVNYITINEDQCDTHLTYDECDNLALQMGSPYYVETENEPGYPPGCYVYGDPSLHLWYYNYYMEENYAACADIMTCYCESYTPDEGILLELSEGDYGVLMAKVNSGNWGYVCADKFLDNSLGPKTACLTMGHTNPNAVKYHQAYVDVGYFSMDNVVCDRNADTIEDCEYTEEHNCAAHEAVWLECTDDVQVEIRLDPESGSTSSGLLLASVNGNEEGYVCADVFDFDDNSAIVACNQLGLPSDSVKVSDIQDTKMEVVLDRVHCNGNENRLDKCQYALDPSLCGSWRVVHLDCAYRKPTNVRLELSDGTNADNGFVMASIDGEEAGNICDDGLHLDSNAVDVICKQLGYMSAAYYYVMGINTRHYVMDDLECDGTEENIVDCDFNTNHNCLAGEAIWVECQNEERSSTSTPIASTDAPVIPDIPNTYTMQLYLTVEYVDQEDILAQLDEFGAMLARSLQLLSTDIVMSAPRGIRRRLSSSMLQFAVYVKDSAQAMDIQNKLVDVTWVIHFQDDVRLQLAGFSNAIIQTVKGDQREYCSFHHGMIGQGSILSTTNSMDHTNCIIDCIEKLNCAGYNFDSKAAYPCTLLHSVTSVKDSSDEYKITGLCIPKGTAEESIKHYDEEGNAFTMESDDEDHDEARTTVAIILTIVILLLLVCVLGYCAYVYGKNKRMEEATKTVVNPAFAVREDPMPMPSQADIIAEQKYLEQVIVANNQANQNNQYSTQKRTIQSIDQKSDQTGDEETGTRQHSNTLSYLAAQPPVYTEKKEEPKITNGTVPAIVFEEPPSYNTSGGLSSLSNPSSPEEAFSVNYVKEEETP